MFFPDWVLASQAHIEAGGIYVHQLAHLFFMLSLIIFIYGLRQRKLTEKTGWRYIQCGAFLFILWSINVIFVRFSEEQAMLIRVENIDLWQIRVSSSWGSWFEKIHYFAKLNYFICVPALLFFFVGLKKLAKKNENSSETNLQ